MLLRWRTGARRTDKRDGFDEWYANGPLGLGRTVGISGDTIVLGAEQHQVGANPAQGAAYLFSRPGPIWMDTTDAEADGRGRRCRRPTGRPGGDLRQPRRHSLVLPCGRRQPVAGRGAPVRSAADGDDQRTGERRKLPPRRCGPSFVRVHCPRWRVDHRLHRPRSQWRTDGHERTHPCFRSPGAARELPADRRSSARRDGDRGPIAVAERVARLTRPASRLSGARRCPAEADDRRDLLTSLEQPANCRLLRSPHAEPGPRQRTH